MSQGSLLAFDFGGTKHTAGLISRAAIEQVLAGELEASSAWIAHRRVISPTGADASYDIQTMIALGKEMLGDECPAAIGVSFGGPVDFYAGVVRLSHHVPGWEKVPLASILAEAFSAPVSVDNDANVAALGEHRFGAGQGCRHLLYMTVSTGVGGGWILDGQPWRGWEGMAGEIGHTVVDPAGPACLCGKQGCLERLASGPYMAQDARSLLAAHPDQGAILRSLVNGDLESITGQRLSEAASLGDELAWQVLGRGAWALGRAIGNAANLVNPQVFVLGGGVTKSGERFWEQIRTTARETALPEVHFEILPAALGDDAPLWGAVALACDPV